ncbi:MAG: hypothetical protein IH944_06510 [Armatimonadetes bacterium]|nr:hypothetical protein [Armatimonadota bacterium]
MLTAILLTILATSPSTYANDVVYKLDGVGIIAPDETAARYAIARLRELNKGFYRVEPMDDGTFYLDYSRSLLHDPQRVSTILKGEYREPDVHVAQGAVEEEGARSSTFAKRVEGGLSVTASSSDLHDVLFDVMKEARRSYQVGPRVNGVVTFSYTSESIESIVGILSRQVNALFLIEGKDLIFIDDAGIIKRRNVGFRGIRPY